MTGIFLVLLGIQFRLIESITLNDKTTRFLANHSGSATTSTSASLFPSSTVPRKTIEPPQWLGWAFISIGAVFILHSLAMKKPGAG